MTARQASFFEKVYDVVQQIPYGRVTTYGAIAKYLGSGGASAPWWGESGYERLAQKHAKHPGTPCGQPQREAYGKTPFRKP
ncbi:MAG: MGMT family protein [Bacteroidales bacterium]|nr:MGMT family protein [Bacteroidales bacterium]